MTKAIQTRRRPRRHSARVLERIGRLCDAATEGSGNPAEAIQNIKRLLDEWRRLTTQPTPAEKNALRIYRTTQDNGWQVIFSICGDRHRRVFMDAAYGTSQAAKLAAEELAYKDLELHAELLALRRRFEPRTSSRSGIPGVARYDATPSRGAYWMAHWTDPVSGRKRAKRFMIDKLGEDLARDEALACRADAVEPLADRYQEILKQLGYDSASIPDQDHEGPEH